MNFSWVITLSLADAGALASLRLNPGIEVATDDLLVWLRGKMPDESTAKALLSLPAVARYEWLSNDQLRNVHDRTPSNIMPPFSWQPLNRWLELDKPGTASAGELPSPIPLHLERCYSEQAADALLTSLDEWTRFAANTGQVRLQPLRFAANESGDVLILGRPLPPLPGSRFVLHERVAIPVGFTWQPHVGTQVLKRVFGTGDHDLILWHEDGSFSRLHSEQFVQATRSAARATRNTFSPPK